VPLFRQTKVGTRALPMAFEEVSVVKRLAASSPGTGARLPGKRPKPLSPLEPEWKQYRAAQKIYNLSARFADLMRRLRTTFDACGAAKKILVLAVDGSFCHRTVFTTVLLGVELIARARKDIRLCFRADDGPRRCPSTSIWVTNCVSMAVQLAAPLVLL